MLDSRHVTAGAAACASVARLTREFGVRVTELNELLFKLKDAADPRADAVEAILEDYLRTAPVARLRPDFNLRTGMLSKQVFELELGGLVIFRRARVDDSFSTWQAGNEVRAYEASKILGFDVVPVTVAREIDGIGGAAQFFFVPEQLDRQIEFQSAARYVHVKLLDWIIQNSDRHRGNELVHRLKRALATDNGWAFEPRGGIPEFIGRGKDTKPLDPFGRAMKEALSIVSTWDRPILERLSRILITPEAGRAEWEALENVATLCLHSAYQRANFAYFSSAIGVEYSKPEIFPDLEGTLSSEGSFRDVRHGQLVTLPIPEERWTTGMAHPELQFSMFDSSGGHVLVRVNGHSTQPIAAVRVPLAKQFVQHFRFELPDLPPGTETICLEFQEERQLRHCKLCDLIAVTVRDTGAYPAPKVPQLIDGSEVTAGTAITINGQSCLVQRKLGIGGRANAFLVVDPSGRCYVLKVSRDPTRLDELLYNEPLLLSLFHHLGFQRYSHVVVIGGNFLLKDHIPGVPGDEWGDRFNAQNPDDVYKAAKLIDMMVEAASKGLCIRFRHAPNFVWTGTDWIIVDPSVRTRVSVRLGATLVEMARDLNTYWLAFLPYKQLRDKLKVLTMVTPTGHGKVQLHELRAE